MRKLVTRGRYYRPFGHPETLEYYLQHFSFDGSYHKDMAKFQSNAEGNKWVKEHMADSPTEELLAHLDPNKRRYILHSLEGKDKASCADEIGISRQTITRWGQWVHDIKDEVLSRMWADKLDYMNTKFAKALHVITEHIDDEEQTASLRTKNARWLVDKILEGESSTGSNQPIEIEFVNHQADET